MSDEHRAVQLQQLANIVIDAYLNRDKRFKPDFGTGTSVFFLHHPSGDKDHSDIQIGYWYERADFEPENHS